MCPTEITICLVSLQEMVDASFTPVAPIIEPIWSWYRQLCECMSVSLPRSEGDIWDDLDRFFSCMMYFDGLLSDAQRRYYDGFIGIIAFLHMWSEPATLSTLVMLWVECSSMVPYMRYSVYTEVIWRICRKIDTPKNLTRTRNRELFVPSPPRWRRYNDRPSIVRTIL
jgi:hypothetical protein